MCVDWVFIVRAVHTWAARFGFFSGALDVPLVGVMDLTLSMSSRSGLAHSKYMRNSSSVTWMPMSGVFCLFHL